MIQKAYHKDLEFLHVNCEEPRAYFVPFDTEEKAVKHERADSEYFMSLCGTWDFKFYESFEDIEEDFLDEKFSDSIAVPMSWQNNVDKGYDIPLYSNTHYPYPLDAPNVPDENPCGHYSKKITLDKAFLDGEVFINFEGVDSCFYLFVNGQFAAYSQVSHCTSEINLTKYLVEGENKIDVLVVKWCDGSFLEDQDCFRLSGIFREVYLLKRDKNYIKDIFAKVYVNENLDCAEIKTALLKNGDFAVSYKLVSPDGEVVCEGESSDNDFSLCVENPVLWNAEEPKLYDFIIKSGNEYINIRLGLKRLEIKDCVAYLNNKAVKLWGMNRHDSDPFTGHAVTMESMIRDLHILKRGNCNTIRTSHYPNDPRFVELCNEMGFMVIDEADIETHGMGHECGDTWDWPRWSKLSTDDEWEESYVDRAKRLFERDKNSVCVVMWSLGNESGCGKNHRAMNKYIKSRDDRAIVHYENSHLEFQGVPIGENFSDISDVESRMYASLEYTRAYLENKNKHKPFYFCEYVCSMSTGDIHAHCDLADEYDSLWGLCIWELTDHAVAVKKEDGTVGFRYGGDFGDYPNDNVCCVDGLVFPDRKLRPGYFDMKRAYQQFKIKMDVEGKISVFNKRYFTTLSDMTLNWELKCDGNVILSGTVGELDIEARSSKEYTLFDYEKVNPYGECYLNIHVVQNTDTEWAEAGYETGFEQFKLDAPQVEKETAEFPAAQVTDSRRYINITANGVSYVFDKSYGRLCSIKNKEKEILAEPVSIEIWKAHGYNQGGAADERRLSSYHHAKQKTYDCEIREENGAVIVDCNISFGGPFVEPTLRGKLTYTFESDGSFKVRFNGTKREIAPRLPRFAFKFVLTPGYENMKYFGCGPHESYPDRHKACYTDLFETTVNDNFNHYVRPMENGSHFGCSYGCVYDENLGGLMFAPTNGKFFFNATHFTAKMLEETKHDDELVPLKETIVYTDINFDINGARGYFEQVEPERKWDDNKIDFEVAVSVIE